MNTTPTKMLVTLDPIIYATLKLCWATNQENKNLSGQRQIELVDSIRAKPLLDEQIGKGRSKSGMPLLN